MTLGSQQCGDRQCDGGSDSLNQTVAIAVDFVGQCRQRQRRDEAVMRPARDHEAGLIPHQPDRHSFGGAQRNQMDKLFPVLQKAESSGDIYGRRALERDQVQQAGTIIDRFAIAQASAKRGQLGKPVFTALAVIFLDRTDSYLLLLGEICFDLDSHGFPDAARF